MRERCSNAPLAAQLPLGTCTAQLRSAAGSVRRLAFVRQAKWCDLPAVADPVVTRMPLQADSIRLQSLEGGVEDPPIAMHL